MRLYAPVVVCLVAILAGVGDSAGQSGKPSVPLSPREQLTTFRVAKGFRVELVAAEPDVIDPVAMTFDEAGRLYVLEMSGYPNGGLGDGQPVIPGKVKLLEDHDGDGSFEKSTIWLDGLRFPTGLTPWRGGLLIGNAPDLLYCKDTDGDGKADLRKVHYTGFGTRNIQQLLNGFQFHFDNGIHACNGLNESVISSPEKPDLPPISLRTRHIRFQPDRAGSLEPTSGGGQYGLTCDNWGNWFTCTNNQHVRHIVLPDHYLRRNPFLSVPEVAHDIPDGIAEHHAAAKVFRISPFEPWRLDRTSRRVANPMGKKFPTTELVPGGYITSATGLIVYRGGVFPREYQGNIFVGDPANNLVHRDVLVPDGPTFKAERHDKNCEFLASTDIWFRPVFLYGGPDGAIYVCDFYREVIETPLSLPEDIQKRYTLQSRQRGRIWRIVAEQAAKAKQPQLSQATSLELVVELANPNAWWRLNAQRLLIERHADSKAVIHSLQKLGGDSSQPMARLHAMWTLEGLGSLGPALVESALKSAEPGIRETGLRLADSRLPIDARLQAAVLTLADDPSPRVRSQLAFTLGSAASDPRVAAALAKLSRRDGANPWMQAAVLSSAKPHAVSLLRDLAGQSDVPATFLSRLAELVAVGGRDEAEIDQTLLWITHAEGTASLRQMAMLEGLARGLAREGRSLSMRLKEKSAASEQLGTFLGLCKNVAIPNDADLSTRLVAIRLLGYGSFATFGRTLQDLLAPQTAREIQFAAVQALASMSDPNVADALLSGWSGYSPAIRREVQEALFSRPDRLLQLLAAIEKGQVLASQIDSARRDQLVQHRNPQIRDRAKTVFANQVPEERKKVVEEFRSVLDLTGEAGRGKALFKQQCATCHRLENQGIDVGPDLLAVLHNKTKETLLIDILDPSREVDPRYLNYVAQNKAGRIFSGMIAAETGSSLVLRRAERAEDTLLRADIEEIQSTAKSLMPEGLEKQVKKQELADLIAYLQRVGNGR